ncbi:urate oxidase [soil metagenome]
MGPNRYGKSGIRLAVVRRDGATHHFTDLEVDIRLSGDFDAVHTRGDNSTVLPTDTMRGTCYALAREGIGSVTDYARRLAERFLDVSPATSQAWVRVTTHPWQRVTVDGTDHPHTFRPAAGGLAVTTLRLPRDGDAVVTCGIAGARVAKTTGSAFSGFLRDDLTTQGETRDRIMATTIEAEWGVTGADAEVDAVGSEVPHTMLAAFAAHDESESVQHTLHAMGWAVLDRHDSVTWIRFRMPNEHHILSDLSPYGLDNPGEVFLVADRPYGVIEGAVAREGVTPEVPW